MRTARGRPDSLHKLSARPAPCLLTAPAPEFARTGRPLPTGRGPGRARLLRRSTEGCRPEPPAQGWTDLPNAPARPAVRPPPAKAFAWRRPAPTVAHAARNRQGRSPRGRAW